MFKERSFCGQNVSKFIPEMHSLSNISGKKLLTRARLLSQIGHRDQKRHNGNHYFEHPQGVYDILYNECGIRNPTLLSISYLHDLVEDSKLFGDQGKLNNTEFRRRARIILTNKFNSQISGSVLDLSKPHVDGKEIKSKNDSNRIYRQQLKICDPGLLLVKMADRLHNLRTLQHASEEMRLKQITETREEYIPLFRRALKDFPKEAGYLISRINYELTNLSTGLHVNSHLATQTLCG